MPEKWKFILDKNCSAPLQTFIEPGPAFEAIKKRPIFVFRVIGLRLSMELGGRHSQTGFLIHHARP